MPEPRIPDAADQTISRVSAGWPIGANVVSSAGAFTAADINHPSLCTPQLLSKLADCFDGAGSGIYLGQCRSDDNKANYWHASSNYINSCESHHANVHVSSVLSECEFSREHWGDLSEPDNVSATQISAVRAMSF